MMDDDTLDMRRRSDNLEADPAKLELFRQLYEIDDLIRAHAAAVPAHARQALDTAIAQALEVVRMLPPARPAPPDQG